MARRASRNRQLASGKTNAGGRASDNATRSSTIFYSLG
jgi:hypothetical protein